MSAAATSASLSTAAARESQPTDHGGDTTANEPDFDIPEPSTPPPHIRARTRVVAAKVEAAVAQRSKSRRAPAPEPAQPPAAHTAAVQGQSATGATSCSGASDAPQHSEIDAPVGRQPSSAGVRNARGPGTLAKEAGRAPAAPTPPLYAATEVDALGLPVLDTATTSGLGGPDSECNWLVPGRVLMGAAPGGARTDGYTNDGVSLPLLHQAGVTDWINVAGPEMGGYIHSATRLAEQGPGPGPGGTLSLSQRGAGLPQPRFATHAIAEFSTATDTVIVAAVRSVVTALRSPRRMVYIHCRAGHGRTGMVAAVVLGTLYPAMSIDTVMSTLQRFHDAREDSWGNWGCPETDGQARCARRLLVEIRAGRVSKGALGLGEV